MTLDDVRDEIIAAIQALTPTTKANARDVFRVVDQTGELDIRDRTFEVQPSGVPIPLGHRMSLADPLVVDFAVLMGYQKGAQWLTRLGQDSPLIARALQMLPRNHAQIQTADVTSGALNSDADGNGAVAEWIVRITYDDRS